MCSKLFYEITFEKPSRQYLPLRVIGKAPYLLKALRSPALNILT